MDGTQLTGHATVSIYVPDDALPSDPVARARPDAVWLASHDPGTQTWVPAESRYDPVAGTVTAVVGHLSWWGVQTWNWASLAIQLRDKLAEFKTLRAAHTDCPNAPGASVAVDGGSDAPAMGCATSSGGNLTVTVTNNYRFQLWPRDGDREPVTQKPRPKPLPG